MYNLENVTSGCHHVGWTRLPVTALVLGALVLSGSASSLDSGWSLLSGHGGVSPPIHHLGKRQSGDVLQNFNWSSVGITSIDLSYPISLIHITLRLTLPKASYGRLVMALSSAQGSR